MEKKPSISRSFWVSVLLVTTVSIGLLGCLWTWQQISAFQRESEELREQMLNAHKELLKDQVERAVRYIEYRKSLTEERLCSSIRDRVYEAHAVANHLHELSGDGQSSERSRTLIKESLRPVRFNQGRGYFFVVDLEGVNQLMADRPEFEGKNMLETEGGKEALVVRDITQLVKNQGEGFYRYDWPKPTAGGSFSKIAFVKLFEPCNWIIGTGEYLDDFQTRIKEEVVSYLGTIKFGKDGYLFLAQWDGLDLMGPAKGRNMLEVTDVNGLKIVQELIQLAKSDGGFLTYVMPKFPGMKPDPKLSYVRGIKDWHWYVGAGIYIDDIEKAIEAKRAELTREIQNSIIQIAVVLIGLMVFALSFAQRTARRASNSFDLFTAFFDKGARDSIVVDPATMDFEEFENLAHSANQMIEARNRAQIALREREEKYRLIVENSNDLIIKLNLEKKVIFASPSYCTLFGQADKRSLDQGLLSVTHEDDREMVIGSLRELDEPPYMSYHEVRVLAASGVRWLAWSSRAILGHDERPVEYVAVGRDITEKKVAEAALRENQQWLQSLLDSIQAGVIVIDPESHTICELNRTAAEIIGTTKEALVGTVCHQHICPSAVGMCPVTDLGRSMEQSDRELLRVDGTTVPILKTVSRSTIHGKDYLIESFLDLSEKRRLESLLLQAQKMEAIGTLAGGIAHDFNNILSPIIGYTELVLESIPDTSPQRPDLDQVLIAASRAKELVKQILAFSRASHEQPLVAMDVSAIIREALKLIRATLPSSIEIKAHLEKGMAMVDATQIHQVMVNLCTNAAHAMDGAGILEVSLTSIQLHPSGCSTVPSADINPAPYIKLSVSDTGQGMDGATQQRIFEPYFTTKEVGKGTGLGLCVVLGIIKRHGGDILVRSEPGKGTVFDVYLPRLAAEVRESTSGSEIIPGGSEHILVVDDEPLVADVATRTLEQLGYRVTSTTSPVHALDLLRSNPQAFDLLFTDYTMPDLSGIDLAREVLQIQPDIPVILCTGFNEKITREMARSIGVRELTMKPLERQELARLVRNALDHRKDEQVKDESPE